MNAYVYAETLESSGIDTATPGFSLGREEEAQGCLPQKMPQRSNPGSISRPVK